MSVVGSASAAEGSTPVAPTWFASSKVHVGLPPVSSEPSPQKTTPPVLTDVRKSSVLSLQELELEADGENGPPPQVSLPKKKVMSRWSLSGFPVSQQEDLSFRVTDRPNGSMIYLPQAHARALEPSDLSSSSSRSVSAGVPVTRPVIAHRQSEEAPFENGAPQAVQHRASASGMPLPPLTRRGSARRSIAETQDSFRENVRRRKSAKYVSTYSPREGSRVPHGNNNASNSGAGGGASGQHATMKARSCCIL